VNVLVNALREHVRAEILNSSSSVPPELLIARLSKRLQDNQGVTAGMARWAVESWGLGLGKLSADQLTKQEEQISRKESRQAPRQKTPRKQSAGAVPPPLPRPARRAT